MKVGRAALLREALQAFRTGRWKTVSGVVVVILCTVGTFAAELSAVGALRAAEDAWIEGGGRLLIASSDTGITSRSCEALMQLPGVAGAVSVERSPQVFESTGAPAEPFGLAMASRSTLDFFDLPEATGAELLLSPRVSDFVPGPMVVVRPATFLDRADGPPIAQRELARSPHPVIRSVPLGDLGPEFERSALVIDPTQRTRALCVVRAQPGWVTHLEPVLASQLETVDARTLTVSRAVALGRFERNFGAEFDARAIRTLPWLAALVVGLFAVGTHWANRREDAVYAIVGLSSHQIRWLRLVQWLSTWAVAGAVSLVACWALWRFAFGAPGWGPAALWRSTLCIFSGSTLLVALGLGLFRTDLMTALKDG